MKYLSHRPSPPLDAFIENLWWLSDAPSHEREQILPSGTFELVVNLDQDEFRIHDREGSPPQRFPGAMVSGAYRKPFVIDTRAHASIIGVHFKPGGALPFIGTPAVHVGDAHVGLEAFWGAAATELRDRLGSIVSPGPRFRMLEDMLVARLPGRRRGHPAVPVAVAELERPDASVAHLSERLGLSHRRFIEVFTRDVGLTPKLFARIRRFQRALRAAEALAAPEWGGLALSCGYYDQAHLINDFSEFAGLSPGEVARRRSPWVKVNHVALPHSAGSILSNTR